MTDQWLPPDDRPPPSAPPAWSAPPSAPPPPPPGFAYSNLRPPWADAIKPGVVPLRPLTLAEVLDGAVRVIRRQPRLTLGLAALVACVNRVVAVAAALATGGISSSSDFGSSFFNATRASSLVGALVASVVSAILDVLLAGMITLVVSEAVLGRKIEGRSLWERLRPLSFRLVVASIAAGLVPLIGLVFLVVPGVFLWGALALTTPALVLERTTVRQALRRSWQLAVPDWWRVWGIRALAVIIAGIVASVVIVPFGIGAAVASVSTNSLSTTGIVLLTIGGIVGNTISAPFVAGVLTLLYIDRRMRAEALDIALSNAARSSPP